MWFNLFGPTTFCKVKYLKNRISTANSSSVADITLHTAQCTPHTAPAPEPAPAHAPVHFILHTKHYRLHTTRLYCMLHIYHFTLFTVKLVLKMVVAKWTLIYQLELFLLRDSQTHLSESLLFQLPFAMTQVNISSGHHPSESCPSAVDQPASRGDHERGHQGQETHIEAGPGHRYRGLEGQPEVGNVTRVLV